MPADNDTTALVRRGINLTPEQKVHIKFGTLYGLGGAVVSATLTIAGLWYSTQGKIDAIKVKVDGVSEDVSALRTDLKPVIEHTAILWDDHQRQAWIRNRP